MGFFSKWRTVFRAETLLLTVFWIPVLFIVTLVFPLSLTAEDNPEKGLSLINTVTDYTGILTREERKELRILSDEIAAETDLRILYLVVERISVFQLNRYEDEEDFASELCRDWKFRKKNKSPVLILFVSKKNQLIIDTSYADGLEISPEMKEKLFSSVFMPRYREGKFFDAFFRLGEAVFGVLTQDEAILKLIEKDNYPVSGEDIDAELSGRALRGIIGFLLFVISLVTSGVFVLEGRRSLFDEKPSGIIKRMITGVPGFVISFIFGVLCYGFLFAITLVEPRWWGLVLLGILFSLFEIGIITLLVKVLFSGMTNESNGNGDTQIPLYAGLRCKKRENSDREIGDLSGGW